MLVCENAIGTAARAPSKAKHNECGIKVKGYRKRASGAVRFAQGDSLKPVKKFTDRKTAVNRIRKAVQALTPALTPQVAPATQKEARTTKGATSKEGAPAAREGSKKAIVLELIRRPDGASIREIAGSTQWIPHSIRGFISGSLCKKMGLAVQSFKRADGERACCTPAN